MNRREFFKSILPLSLATAFLAQGKPPEKEKTSEGIITIHKDGKQYCVPLLEIEEKEYVNGY